MMDQMTHDLIIGPDAPALETGFIMKKDNYLKILDSLGLTWHEYEEDIFDLALKVYDARFVERAKKNREFIKKHVHTYLEELKGCIYMTLFERYMLLDGSISEAIEETNKACENINIRLWRKYQNYTNIDIDFHHCITDEERSGYAEYRKEKA